MLIYVDLCQITSIDVNISNMLYSIYVDLRRIHIGLCKFTSIYVDLRRIYCVRCPSSPHTPIHKGIHKGGARPKAAPPLCEGRPSLMDGCVEAGGAANTINPT